MRLTTIACLLLATTSCSAFGGNSALNIHGGLRNLSSDVATVEDAPVYGIEGTVGIGNHWGVEGSVFLSEEDGDDLGGGLVPSVESSEFALGVRRTFLPKSPVKLYVGGGVNWMDAEISGLGVNNESDDGVGGYAHIGAVFAILMFNVGLDLRGAVTGAELAGEDLNYVQGTVFLGFTF